MSLILFIVINASIFSIGGIGEDRGIFGVPFTYDLQNARIEFLLRPEFNVLNKGSDVRGIFWTHPFYFNFAVPVTKGFVFGMGNLERFNQSFDVYLERDELEMHVKSKGGVDEVYAQLGNNFGIGEVSFRGSYLFGNGSEVWDYTIGDYSLSDSFLYKYRGKIFCGGVRVEFISLSYEGFGTIEMEKEDSNTTIDLPDRLALGLNPPAFGGRVNIMVEHSFWSENDDYRSPTRLKIDYTKNRVGIGYMYNPWYLTEVTEHGVNLSYRIPIRPFGSISLDLGCSLKHKGSLREITVLPEFKLTFQELFARRRE